MIIVLLTAYMHRTVSSGVEGRGAFHSQHASNAMLTLPAQIMVVIIFTTFHYKTYL